MKLSFIVIGTNQAKHDKGFGGKGNWNLLKCFYGEEGRYGEFYFNFNPKTGEAEIKSKDTNYSKALLAGMKEELGIRSKNS